ncbi:MAG: TonB-dependent receptor [Bacteroidetes bacterium]|nr:TonB-dependent receptor [Bacteroidota bacterium]
MKTKIIISTFLFLCFFLSSKSQTISVFAKDDKQALIGASIAYKVVGDTNAKPQGISTDKGGKAVLPCNSTSQKFAITVFFIGYETISDTVGCADYKYFLRSISKELNEVVVTAQYQEGSPDKSVYKVKVIDSKEIEQRGATNLKDLLQQELNIRLTQDNVLGTGMTLGGVSGENVKILIDGVPVTGRTGGNIDLSQLNLSNVERIEIVEGPLSVSYGTNALGGAINIITKKTQYERIEVGLDTYYETVGQYNTDIKAGYKFGTNTIQLTAGRNYFDGWSRTDDLIKFPKVQPADTTRYQDWKPREQYQSGLHYHKNFKTLQLHLVSNYFQEQITNKGMPREPYNETAFDDYYNTFRFDNTASLSGKISKTKNINFQLAYNDYKRIKNTYYKDLTTLEENLTTSSSDQDTTKFKLINVRGTYSTSNDSAKINYEIGYDINIDNSYGLRIKEKEQQIGDYAIFASTEYSPIKIVTDKKFRMFTIRPGLRYAYNTSYSSPIVPSLNLIFRPKEKIAIRASYARGFRAPGLKELYFEFVDINHNIFGNPDLKAETSNNYQTSVSLSGSSGRKFWRIEPSFFYNDINNLITLAYMSGGNKYSYINIGEYNTYGGQFNTEFGEQELMLSFGGALYWTHSEMTEDDGHTDHVHTNVAHDYTPELRGAVKYQIIKTKTQFALFYKYSGKVLGYHYDEDGELQQHWMDDYHTFDLTINQPLFKKRAVLAVGAKNLLNVRYIGIFNMEHTSHTGPHSAHSISMPVNWGRTFFINLKINLSKRMK